MNNKPSVPMRADVVDQLLVLLYLVFALGGYTGGLGSVVPW